LLLLLIGGVFLIIKYEGDLFVLLPILPILWVFLEIYYLLAKFPAEIAHTAVVVFDETFGKRKEFEILTFWSLLDALKQKRLLCFLFLVILLAIFLVSNLYFLFSIESSLSTTSFEYYQNYLFLLTMAMIILVFYIFLEVLNCGKVNIPKIDHPKFINLKKVVENLSIRTGLSNPICQVLAYNNPTIFTIQPIFEKPIIYITAPLLEMANENELEALVAHEFAKIYSGTISFFRRIQIFLIILRALAFSFFLLVLFKLNPVLVSLWFVLVFHLSLNLIETASPNKSPFELALKLMNPPLLIVSFLSYLIFYYVSRTEEFYIDVKTIELTRYPAGIYSILEKMKNYSGNRERLPKRFSYLYFTPEENFFDEIPAPKPSIEERKATIEKIDITLKTSSLKCESREIKCPNCQNFSYLVKLQGLYGEIINSYYCKKCDSFWFETWENLLRTGYHFSETVDLKKKVKEKVKINKNLKCPNCGVDMLNKSLLFNIQILFCPVCKSCLISKNDLFKYATYKKTVREKR